MAHWHARFIQWLAQNGYSPEFCTDFDLHREPDLCRRYRLVLSVGDDEYWSEPMRRNWKRSWPAVATRRSSAPISAGGVSMSWTKGAPSYAIKAGRRARSITGGTYLGCAAAPCIHLHLTQRASRDLISAPLT